eukprot:4392-Heterococcus_DN1.PRE.1
MRVIASDGAAGGVMKKARITLRDAAAERCAAAQALDSIATRFPVGFDKFCHAASSMDGVRKQLYGTYDARRIALSCTSVIVQLRSSWLLFEQLSIYPWTQLFSPVFEALCLTDSLNGLSQCKHSVSPCVEDIRAVAVLLNVPNSAHSASGALNEGANCSEISAPCYQATPMMAHVLHSHDADLCPTCIWNSTSLTSFGHLTTARSYSGSWDLLHCTGHTDLFWQITLSRDSVDSRPRTMSHLRLLRQHATTARTLYAPTCCQSAVSECRAHYCYTRAQHTAVVLCSTDNILDYAFMHLLTTCATADASETEL